MSEKGGFKAFDERVVFFQTNGKMPEGFVTNYVQPSEQMVKVNVPDAKGRRSSHVTVMRSQVHLVFGQA